MKEDVAIEREVFENSPPLRRKAYKGVTPMER
jgi:hypothetical protein